MTVRATYTNGFDADSVRDNNVLPFVHSHRLFQLTGVSFAFEMQREKHARACTTFGACLQCCGVAFGPGGAHGRRSDLAKHCEWREALYLRVAIGSLDRNSSALS